MKLYRCKGTIIARTESKSGNALVTIFTDAEHLCNNVILKDCLHILSELTVGTYITGTITKYDDSSLGLLYISTYERRKD